MTMGSSKTVFAFLKNAAKDRVFQVIVAEGAPSYQVRLVLTNYFQIFLRIPYDRMTT